MGSFQTNVQWESRALITWPLMMMCVSRSSVSCELYWYLSSPRQQEPFKGTLCCGRVLPASCSPTLNQICWQMLFVVVSCVCFIRKTLWLQPIRCPVRWRPSPSQTTARTLLPPATATSSSGTWTMPRPPRFSYQSHVNRLLMKAWNLSDCTSYWSSSSRVARWTPPSLCWGVQGCWESSGIISSVMWRVGGVDRPPPRSASLPPVCCVSSTTGDSSTSGSSCGWVRALVSGS